MNEEQADEQQEQWVLAHRSKTGRHYPSAYSASETILVRSKDTWTTDLTEAARDPANVLNVDALPELVKRFAQCIDELESSGYHPDHPSLVKYHTALASVHP